MRVPDELQILFRGGQPEGDKNNLPRLRFRYKVVEVAQMIDTDTDDPLIVTRGRRGSGHTNEFTTRRGAQRYANRLAREGRTALIQVGVICWLSEKEVRAVPALAPPSQEPKALPPVPIKE